nr:hypothetical protein [Tanacetum cinerariifolium]
MLNSSTGLFFLQFSSMDGLNLMLENGSWFVRNNPLILKKWNPDVNLLKEDVGYVPVWVKLNGVPVTTFSEDGFSAIATKFGTPLMLDSYTSDMCMQSWGRSRYARAMIELRADVELKDTTVVAMPKHVGEGFYTCAIHVEYEWKPPRCGSCKVFGNVQDECPKNIGSGVAQNLKNPSQAPRGVPVGHKGKHLEKVDYSSDHDSENEVKPVDNEMASFLASKRVAMDDDMYEGQEIPNKNQSICDNLISRETLYVKKINELESQMLDGKLMLVGDDGTPLKSCKSMLPSSSNVASKKVDDPVNEDSDDEVLEVYNETATFMASTNEASKSSRGGGQKSLYENGRMIIMKIRTMMTTLMILV